MSAKKLKVPAGFRLMRVGETASSLNGDKFKHLMTGKWTAEKCMAVELADHHVPYITPIKPAPAKAKRAGKPVKAVKASTSGEFDKGPLFHIAGRGHCSKVYPVPIFVLPADAESVARMVEQAAKALAVADYKDETHAAEAMLAAIGIAGRRK